MAERRNFIRWQVNREAKVQLFPQEGCYDCHIKDINYKGAQVVLGHEHELKKDEYIGLNIILSEDCILKLEVWVAWHKTINGHNIYGVYFSRIKDFDKEQIYRFIRKYYPEQVLAKWWGGLREETKQEKGGEVMDDRRIFERIQVKFPARYLDIENNREGDGQVQDLCAKGLCLVTKEELKPKAPLEIWLNIPDKGEPLYTRGEVVWVRPEGTNECRSGICFEKASFMDLTRVLRISKD